MKASLPGPALPVTLAAQFPAHVAEADAGRGGEAWRARAGVRPMLGLSAMLLGPLASLPLPRLSALPGTPGWPDHAARRPRQRCPLLGFSSPD